MVTTSSTTSTPTPTPTPTPSASSVMGSAAQALFTSLATGSGIDTASLVTSLVQAQFATKTDALKAQQDAVTAQISGISTLKSDITTFATALKTLTTNGSLQSQPQTTNSNVLTASAQSGAVLTGLTASITVSQLASAQVATTQTAIADRSTVLGSGQFTLTLGTATYSSDGSQMTGFTAGSGTPVTIDVTDGSLDSIASAINAKKAGVTASVVTDVDGKAYLSLKGTSGTTQAFTLQATSDQIRSKRDAMYGQMQEKLAGIQTVKGFGQERWEARSFMSTTRELMGLNVQQGALGGGLWTVAARPPAMDRSVLQSTVVMPAGRTCVLSGFADRVTGDHMVNGVKTTGSEYRMIALVKTVVIAPDVAPDAGVILRGR